MRPVRFATLAAALVLGACSTPAVSGELPGAVPEGVTFHEAPADAVSAPAFELDLIDGQTLDLPEQWSERPIVLVFFETWCTLCQSQQADINNVADDYRDLVLFVGIAGLSATEDITEYVAEHRISYPIGTDPDGVIWLKYAVAEPPLVALISKDGRLLRGWPGGVSGEDLSEQIAHLAVQAH